MEGPYHKTLNRVGSQLFGEVGPTATEQRRRQHLTGDWHAALRHLVYVLLQVATYLGLMWTSLLPSSTEGHGFAVVSRSASQGTRQASPELKPCSVMPSAAFIRARMFSTPIW